MLNYLKKHLGTNIFSKSFHHSKDVPSYLINSYDYSLLKIFNVHSLFVKPKDFNLHTYKKHLIKLLSFYDYQIVLLLDEITPYQREALIKNKIPFVVKNSQIFLPFIGIVLQEKFKKSFRQIDKFTPSTQLVFIYWFYNFIDSKVTATVIAKMLDIPVMSANRAFIDLVSTGLFNYEIVGNKKVLILTCKKEELLRKIEGYLRNPLYRKVYITNESLIENPMYAGIYALGEKSLLSVDTSELTIAIYKKVLGNIDTKYLVDENYYKTMGSITLEVWSYDPRKLSKSGFIDDISLILSLESHSDERVQAELLKLKERYLW